AGILTTNDEHMYQELKLWRHHGLKNREEVVHWGYNSRLDSIQAAVLRTRLPKLPAIIEKRRANAALYTERLKGIVQTPTEGPDEYHTFHVYVIQCERRNDLLKYLLDRGIETKIHYPIPIHLQKAAEYLGYAPGGPKAGLLPNTDRQSSRILSLPINQYIRKDQIDWVCQSIREFYGKKI
ncbi:MAG: DegT/DnrJ/EryC1/StrS family aminotransferase, partial [Bdellovibrionota bacterium]